MSNWEKLNIVAIRRILHARFGEALETSGYREKSSFWGNVLEAANSANNITNRKFLYSAWRYDRRCLRSEACAGTDQNEGESAGINSLISVQRGTKIVATNKRKYEAQLLDHQVIDPESAGDIVSRQADDITHRDNAGPHSDYTDTHDTLEVRESANQGKPVLDRKSGYVSCDVSFDDEVTFHPKHLKAPGSYLKPCLQTDGQRTACTEDKDSTSQSIKGDSSDSVAKSGLDSYPVFPTIATLEKLPSDTTVTSYSEPDSESSVGTPHKETSDSSDEATSGKYVGERAKHPIYCDDLDTDDDAETEELPYETDISMSCKTNTRVKDLSTSYTEELDTTDKRETCPSSFWGNVLEAANSANNVTNRKFLYSAWRYDRRCLRSEACAGTDQNEGESAGINSLISVQRGTKIVATNKRKYEAQLLDHQVIDPESADDIVSRQADDITHRDNAGPHSDYTDTHDTLEVRESANQGKPVLDRKSGYVSCDVSFDDEVTFHPKHLKAPGSYLKPCLQTDGQRTACTEDKDSTSQSIKGDSYDSVAKSGLDSYPVFPTIATLEKLPSDTTVTSYSEPDSESSVGTPHKETFDSSDEATSGKYVGERAKHPIYCDDLDTDDDAETEELPYETDISMSCKTNTRVKDLSTSYTEELDTTDKRETCPGPENFDFEISPGMWQTVRPQDDRSGLTGKWTDVFAGKFREQNKACVLKFVRNRTKQPNSRKVSAPFCRAVGECVFSGCCQYIFTMNTCPQKDQPAKVCVKREGHVSHGTAETKKRHTRSDDRKTVAQELRQDGTANWFYSKLSSMSDISLKAGNTDECKNLTVLHKILSESNQQGSLSIDDLQEVKLLQDVYREIDDAPKVPGYVQYFSCNPFKVHLYCEEQLKLYSSDKVEKVLYMDATGSLVKNISGQKAPVFLYSVVFKNPVPGKTAIPLAEMLSNDHHSAEIRHFLSRLLNDLTKLRTKTVVLPRRVESDFSWAMLNAILSSMNNEDAKSYLNRTWAILHFKQTFGQMRPFTYPHLCSAHMIHLLATHLKRLQIKRQTAQLTLYCFGLLVNCIALSSAADIFRHMCVVLGSQNRLATAASIDKLRYMMSEQNVASFCDEEAAKETSDEGDQEAFEKAHTKTSLRQSSPYFTFFRTQWQEVQNSQTAVDPTNVNDLHSPQTIELLLASFLYAFPLWSGVMMGNLKRYDSTQAVQPQRYPETRSTNSLVENWFGKTKKDLILKKGQRCRPGEFIRKEIVRVRGRLNEVELLKPCHSQKRTDRPPRIGSDLEEKWKPKRMSSDGKTNVGKYFTPPSDGAYDSQKARGNILAVGAPSWGGTAKFKGQPITLSNTCPIDNLLLIFHQIFTQHEKLFERIQKENNSLCRLLHKIKLLCDTNCWTLAKMWWLHSMCGYEVDDGARTWDIFGSEHENFVKHLDGIQGSVQNSVCSDQNCPRPNRDIISPTIDLSAPSTGGDIQQCLVDHQTAFTSPCRSLSGDGSMCEGTRIWQERRFQHFNGCPPILVFSPTYLSGNELKTTPYDDNITVSGRRYVLFGITVSTGSHFIGYFRRYRGWVSFDGLRQRDRCQQIGDRKQLKGTVEHLVYVSV